MNTPTQGGIFLRFQIITFWGLGGGLNFFSTCPVKCAHEWIYFEPTKKCYKYFATDESPTIANDYCQSNFKVKLKFTKREKGSEKLEFSTLLDMFKSLRWMFRVKVEGESLR